LSDGLSLPTSTLGHTPTEAPLHDRHEVDEVLRLVAEGWNDSQTSRATGIPRSTINHWRHGRLPNFGSGDRGRPSTCPRCDGAPLDIPAYAYLLGLYLGDGHIVNERRTNRLSIYQDGRYQQLVNLAAATILRVRNGMGKVGFVHRSGCVAITAHWNHWPCVFPQHGPGLKHRRAIRLDDWQCDIVARCPRQLLRGLIHSDGCRVMNRVRNGKYAYPRYFFTNTSEDILQIFRDACDAIDVPYRDSKWNTVSVARGEGVAALDAFIGPKA
jgi:hypothetical protein